MRRSVRRVLGVGVVLGMLGTAFSGSALGAVVGTSPIPTYQANGWVSVISWATHEPYTVIDLDVDANGVLVAGGGNGGNFASLDPLTGARQWSGGTTATSRRSRSLAASCTRAATGRTTAARRPVRTRVRTRRRGRSCSRSTSRAGRSCPRTPVRTAPSASSRWRATRSRATCSPGATSPRSAAAPSSTTRSSRPRCAGTAPRRSSRRRTRSAPRPRPRAGTCRRTGGRAVRAPRPVRRRSSASSRLRP